MVLFEDLSRHHLVLPGKNDQLDMIPIAHSMSSVGGILVCKGDQGATLCQTPVIFSEKQQNTLAFL